MYQKIDDINKLCTTIYRVITTNLNRSVMEYFSRSLCAPLVATLAFISAAFWWMAFPLVSISTGELKPRGLYVDENALLVNAASSQRLLDFIQLDNKKRHLDPVFVSSIKDLCPSIERTVTSAECKSLTIKDSLVAQITVDSFIKGRSHEITAIILPFQSNTRSWAFTVAVDLANRLANASSMSKRLLILLLECPAVDVPEALTNPCLQVIDSWLFRYHGLGLSTAYIPHEGLLRDAYVIDMTGPDINCHGMDENATINKPSSSSSAMYNSIALCAWSSIELQVAGINGQLPNMDLLSAPLVLFPDVFVAGGHPVDTVEKQSQYRVAFGTVEASVCLLMVKSIGRSFSVYCENYFRLLGTLVSFFHEMVIGPINPHAPMLGYNIDALTLRPVVKRPTFPAINATTRQRDRFESDVKNGAVLTAAAVPAIVERLIRMSSNLHGKQSMWLILL